MEARNLIDLVKKMNHFLVVILDLRILRLDPITSLNVLFQSAFGILVQTQRPDEMAHKSIERSLCLWIVIIIVQFV